MGFGKREHNGMATGIRTHSNLKRLTNDERRAVTEVLNRIQVDRVVIVRLVAFVVPVSQRDIPVRQVAEIDFSNGCV
jgi:hypothetical protein